MKVRPRKKVDATFNMSSMTDIVFLLLIFFIVLSTFVSPPGVPVDLPRANAPVVPEATQMTVSIDKDLNYSLNSNPMSYEALLSELKSKVASLSEASVKLSADRTVPIENGIMLFADIKKLGYKKVVIATQPVKK